MQRLRRPSRAWRADFGTRSDSLQVVWLSFLDAMQTLVLSVQHAWHQRQLPAPTTVAKLSTVWGVWEGERSGGQEALHW